MNILFLDQFSELGGAQRCLLDLLPAIEQRGWGARAAVPPKGPLVKLLRQRGLQVEEIPCGPYECGRKSAADLLQLTEDLPRQIAVISRMLEGTDLVYVNGPRLLIAAALAIRGRVPMLFHAHHRIGQSSARYLLGLFLRGSSVVACCNAVAWPLRDWVAEERIHVIANGTEDFGFAERTFRTFRIGIVGRISPEKGQTQFLHAVAALIERGVEARFVVCGAPLFSDEGYYQQVLRLAAGLPVEFLDWQDDVGAVMRDLDVLVIASKQEGMPRVLLEAFSAGLPVVAFPVGGIPEVIKDGITGFLANDLAEALQGILSAGPETLRNVAWNARAEWKLRYTVNTHRERIADLIQQLVLEGRETGSPQSCKAATPQ